MATLLIPGIADLQPERSDLARALPPGMVEVKHAARVDVARAVSGQLRIEGLQPDDVVEIELEDGLRLWSRVDDLERDFGLIGGNIFHGELTVDQLFHMRPAVGYADYRTPIKGLYQGSSATHAGGGVTGMPGHHVVREIMRDKA